MWKPLLRFDGWANWRVLGVLEEMEAPPPRAVRWMAHIVGAKRIWLARLRGEPQPNERFPDWSLEHTRARLEEVEEGWARYLEGVGEADWGRIQSYQDTSGVRWETPLGEVVAHVGTHGHYHRGQIAVELGASGRTPPVTDLIEASREGLFREEPR